MPSTETPFDMLCMLVKRQLAAYHWGDASGNPWFVLTACNPGFNLRVLKELADNGTIELHPIGGGNCSLRITGALLVAPPQPQE